MNIKESIFMQHFSIYLIQFIKVRARRIKIALFMKDVEVGKHQYFNKSCQRCLIQQQKAITGHIIKMGNKGSQFENQFFKRYSFIQTINDKSFGLVKIYRKNSVKFDYIMILEVQLQNLAENQIEILEERLKQVRTHQNQSTLRVYHYKFLEPARIQCRHRRILVYAQYMNRSIFDYLSALRSNPKFLFDVSEIIYVVRNVSKGCIALKRMGITHPDLSSRKVFLSPEGEALLCPLLYILQSIKGTASYNEVDNLQNRYQKYSITCLHQNTKISSFSLKPQLTNLLLEMTGNIPQKRLQETTFIYRLIQQSTSVEDLYSRLPEVQTETMKIQQMQRMENIPGEFYDIN